MCHIWKQKRDTEISPADLRKVLANPLFRRVTSVGINGGEPTLRKDLAELAAAAGDALPRLERFNLITNAIVPKRVMPAIDALADLCAARGLHLDVMVSLDGIGEVHDRVRGIRGNFASAVEVLDHVQAHAGVHSTRIGCTVIRENVHHVEEVLHWCRSRALYARFRLGIPHKRLYGADLVAPFALTWDERFHFANFLDYLYLHYEREEGRRAFYRSLRDQVIYDAPRTAGCSWKNEGVTLLHDGGLAYCAVESRTLGNAIAEDAGSLYWSNADHLASIVSDKCRNCHHDYEGIADRRTYVRSVAKTLARSLPAGLPLAAASLGRRRRLQDERRRLSAVRVLPDSGRRKKATSRRVLVCGWYGTETLGDKAILGGIVQTLREAVPGVTVDVAAIEPYVTENTKRQMPALGLADVLDLPAAKTRVRAGTYGLLVLGGGPLMTGVSQLIDILELFGDARAAGTATLVAGCGIGPLGGEREVLVREILERADRVLLRDRGSVDTARAKLGWAGEVGVILDPAFLWIAREQQALPPPPDGCVLLALREWPVHEYAGGLSADEALRSRDRFESETVRFVDRVGARVPGAAVTPFCMHKQAVGGDDRMFYRRLFAGRPDVLNRLDDRHRTPAEDLAAFRASRLVVAMRFHSVVFALSTGRPFVAVDYTLGGKIAGLLADLHLSDRLIPLPAFEADRAWDVALGEPPAISALEAPLEAARRTLAGAFTDLLS
jgi:polysaccharide pyruvyl transferase WcaK-like protein/MoaA/NifB/PqqE/SkfB family radical SAM enzyme